MLRATFKLLGLCCLVLAGAIGIWVYQDRFAASHEIARLTAQKAALEQFIQRLGDERRVGELLVTDQKTDAGGELHTTLMFVEYTRTGESMPPRVFQIDGKLAHIDAMVIKFDRQLVGDGDPLRGKSIALFTKIYGDKQSPAAAESIDQPNKIPEIYREADPSVSVFEQQLWTDFWKLTNDESARKEKGVRVAQGEGVWGMFEPGKLYRLTLDADGGLNLTSEPLRGIYREALKKHET